MTTLDELELEAKIVGSLTIVMFYISFISAYAIASLKGKIGIHYLNPKKSFLVSTALKYSSTVVEIITVYIFLVLCTWFYSYKGFMYFTDVRAAVPLIQFAFGISFIMMLFYSPKFKNSHKILAFFLMVTGTLLAVILYLIYQNHYPELPETETFKNITIAICCSFVTVVISASLSIYFGKKYPLLWDILALLELAHPFIFSLLFIQFINMPPLPLDLHVTLSELKHLQQRGLYYGIPDF